MAETDYVDPRNLEPTPEERVVPGSALWYELIETDPDRVCRGLTPAERRLADCNPRHPGWLGAHFAGGGPARRMAETLGPPPRDRRRP